jgi:hypothetical protein
MMLLLRKLLELNLLLLLAPLLLIHDSLSAQMELRAWVHQHVAFTFQPAATIHEELLQNFNTHCWSNKHYCIL